MERRAINSVEAPASAGGYSQAVETTAAERVLYISGQIPIDVAGDMPIAFGDQCRLAWNNVEAQLNAAGMTLDNLVKVTTFLGDRTLANENGKVRREVLGDRAPALTVIITGIYDEAWLVEIEAIAVA